MIRLLLYAAVLSMCRCAPLQKPSSSSLQPSTTTQSSFSSIGTIADAVTMPSLAGSTSPMYQVSRRPRSARTRYETNQSHQEESNAAARNERSANLSHITGTSRKIQMHVKNKLLQLLPDGVVNGTANDSDYTILQRTTINVGQIRIQAVATCLFLCMDSCGLLYGSKVFTEDCVFTEKLGEGNYNTYSSTLYSGRLRTLYLALNKYGQPRKVQIPAARPLGKLSTYARTLPMTVSAERMARLSRDLGIKPGARICPLVPLRPSVAPEMDEFGRDRARCRRRKKRKKRKRKDEHNDESPMPTSAVMKKKKPLRGKKHSSDVPVKKHGPKHRPNKHHHGRPRKKVPEQIETTMRARTTVEEDEDFDGSTEDEWEETQVTASMMDYEDAAK